jgi:hypothetical protein
MVLGVMRRLLWAAVVWVCLTGLLQAESKRGLWLRRLTLAAACASSFWDLHTTGTALRSGAVESNPLLVDGVGSVRSGRMLGVKLAVCAGSGISQEVLQRNPHSGSQNYAWTGVNAAMAAGFSAAALRNRGIAADLKRQPPSSLLRADR